MYIILYHIISYYSIVYSFIHYIYIYVVITKGGRALPKGRGHATEQPREHLASCIFAGATRAGSYSGGVKSFNSKYRQRLRSFDPKESRAATNQEVRNTKNTFTLPECCAWT